MTCPLSGDWLTLTPQTFVLQYEHIPAEVRGCVPTTITGNYSGDDAAADRISVEGPFVCFHSVFRTVDCQHLHVTTAHRGLKVKVMGRANAVDPSSNEGSFF